MSNLREAEMFPAVRAWLEARGLTVWTEVPYYDSPIDVVGANLETGIVIAVEMKTSLSRHVIQQAGSKGWWATERWAAVGTRPRQSSIDRLVQREGNLGRTGLLLVDGAECVPLVQAVQCERGPGMGEGYIKRMLEKLAKLEPGGVGGVPCLRGVGPAQDVQRRVDEYRREHPDATWQELYEKVPNHYASARSMQGSLANNAKWIAARERERLKKAETKRKDHAA